MMIPYYAHDEHAAAMTATAMRTTTEGGDISARHITRLESSSTLVAHMWSRKATISMARNAIMYRSRNRQSGTLMLTVDTRHADTDKVFKEFGLRTTRSKQEQSLRYAAVCVDHKTVKFFQENYPAGRAIAHPGKLEGDAETEGWCPKCVQMVKDGKKVTPEGKTTAVEAQPTKAQDKAPANGKRTSSKQANNQARKVQRDNERPGPVVSKTPEAEAPSEDESQDETTPPEPVVASAEA